MKKILFVFDLFFHVNILFNYYNHLTKQSVYHYNERN